MCLLCIRVWLSIFVVSKTSMNQLLCNVASICVLRQMDDAPLLCFVSGAGHA